MCQRTICITGIQACMLLRIARLGKGLIAIPCDDTSIAPLDGDIHCITDLHLDSLCNKLHIDDTHPLNLLVPNIESRRWCKTIRTHVLSTTLPNGSFLQLVPGEDKATRMPIPEGLRILIESPPLALVQGARSMQRLVKLHKMSRQAAILRLMEFADESCGWYVRDPDAPRTGTITYDDPKRCSRLCDVSTIRNYIKDITNVDGITLARLAARHAIDGTGSPMEAYLHHGLSLPPRYGGLSIKMPLANSQLQTNDATRAKLKHQSIRPDLQWPEFHTVAEYLGDKEHAARPARIEDKDRMQDYMVAGYTAFPLMFDDVRNAAALGRTAQMIARELMRNGAREELYHVRKILNNKDFVARQSILVATLLPPITRYGNV